jgi:hypothetical protein
MGTEVCGLSSINQQAQSIPQTKHQILSENVRKALSVKNKWSFRTAKLFSLLAVPYFSNKLLGNSNCLTFGQAVEIISCATSY